MRMNTRARGMGKYVLHQQIHAWWRHQIETFSSLLDICAGNSPVTGEFPAQRPVTWSFDIFFDLRPNKQLSKQCWGWWFETPSRPLLCHCSIMCCRDCWHQASRAVTVRNWAVDPLLLSHKSSVWCMCRNVSRYLYRRDIIGRYSAHRLWFSH